jgi:uncharacterized protein YjbJ (UPF0337 family)
MKKTASCLTAALIVLFVAAPILHGEENQGDVKQTAGDAAGTATTVAPGPNGMQESIRKQMQNNAQQMREKMQQAVQSNLEDAVPAVQQQQMNKNMGQQVRQMQQAMQQNVQQAVPNMQQQQMQGAAKQMQENLKQKLPKAVQEAQDKQ